MCKYSPVQSLLDLWSFVVCFSSRRVTEAWSMSRVVAVSLAAKDTRAPCGPSRGHHNVLGVNGEVTDRRRKSSSVSTTPLRCGI